MKLSFHGATGTKHLLTLDNGQKYLLDCGMFQGMGTETDTLNSDFGFDAKETTCLFLSHAHIDHSGLIPKLVKEGFSGKIYSTQATKDLAEILLCDSAEIQMHEAEYVKQKSTASDNCEPLYTAENVNIAMTFFETVQYNEWLQADEDVEVMYSNAGPLIGSAAINLRVTENGKNDCNHF